MAPMSVNAPLAVGGATASVLISVRSYNLAVLIQSSVVISVMKSTSVNVNQVRGKHQNFHELRMIACCI